MQETGKTGANQRAIPVIGVLVCVIGLLSGCVLSTTKDTPTAPEPVAQEPTEPPCPVLSARELERESIELLDRGESDEARRLLNCVIEDNPGSRRAQTLIRQLDADPVEFLGPRHYIYTVKPSETLSKIAGERLGDDMQFVILARYNDIPVPANLAAGQRIRIPGDRPAEPAEGLENEEPEPTQSEVAPALEPEPAQAAGATDMTERYNEALALERQEDLNGAFKILNELKDLGSDLPGIDDDLARVRSALVFELEDKAYGLELEGAIDKALATWQRLLEIDPSNIPARLSIRRLTQ